MVTIAILRRQVLVLLKDLSVMEARSVEYQDMMRLLEKTEAKLRLLEK
jgi:hypothetical protein